MASRHVRSIHHTFKAKKRGYYELIDGKLVWQHYPQDKPKIPDNKHRKLSRPQNGLAANQVHFSLAETSQQQEFPGSQNPKKSYLEKKKDISSEWAALHQQFVEQLVENAYPVTFLCCRCRVPLGTASEPLYRCLDCGPMAYFCQDCCNYQHGIVFLHLPQVWNAGLKCFDDYNHSTIWRRPDNHQCITASSTPIIIIDAKGRQHYQPIEVCKCKPTPVILLEYGIWPASTSIPRVGFSLNFMLILRSMVLEGQLSLQSFCSSMQNVRSRLYRGKTMERIEDIYRVINWETVLNFMSVYHSVTYLQFADIEMPDGTLCQVCPEEADDEGRKMAMDGNMNLVHRAKAGHSIREPLHKGRFFLCQNDVDRFVIEHAVSTNNREQTCSTFQAGSVLRTKNKTEKLDFTGTFASICSHDFPCSIFNMRFGERMAYPIFMMKSMQNLRILMYDLGCQLEPILKKNNILSQVTFGVPIFHVYGHKMSCQLTYSPRRVPGAGLFDGEGTERLWSYLGNFKIITKEMTPENRTDLLVEALLNYGERLTMKMAESLSRRLAKVFMLKESTDNMIEESLLLLPNVTAAEVEKWMEEEKKQAMANQKKKNDSWEHAYVMQLHKYYKRIDELPEDAELDEETLRLGASLARIEKRHKLNERWGRNTDKYTQHLIVACEEERHTRLVEVRDAVVQYTFMVTLKTRYAHGQSLAKRIMVQVITTSKKITSALQNYNAVPSHGDTLPHHLQRSEVAALDSEVWHHLARGNRDEGGVPYLLKRKLIDTVNLNRRAEEEIKTTMNDMGRLVRSLNRQQTKLQSELCRLSEKDSLSNLEKGSMSLLIKRLQGILDCQKTVTFILSQVACSRKVNVQQFLDAVESQISRDIQAEAETPGVSEESVQEMKRGIQALMEENAHDDEGETVRDD